MKKFILSFFVIALAFLLIGCNKQEEKQPTGGEKTSDPTPAATISYDVKEKTLKVGETFVIEVSENVGFAVGNSKIISLDKATKTVTALASGETTLTIYLNDNPTVKVTVKFTVEADEPSVTPEPSEKEKYTISYDLDGGLCDGLVLEFEENTYPNLPIPTKEGFDFLGWFEGETQVRSINANKNYELVAKWQAKEVLPESIEIILSNEEEIYYLDTPLQLSYKVLPEGASQEVEWKAINKSKATLNDDLTVNILHGNEATFKVTSTVNEDVSASITIKIRAYINPTNFINSLAVDSEDIVAQKIRAYSSNEGYETYILGSVYKLLFEKITITENWVPEGAYNRPGTTTADGLRTFYPWFICVHDVGAPGNAKANSDYCVNPGGTEVSYHFTVGNDGIFQQLPLNEIGWHAADGTGVAFTWDDSGVVAEDDSDIRITINQTNGKYMIGDKETLITAPTDSAGRIVPNSKMPYTGINYTIDNDPKSSTYRHYLIGTTYFNTGYGIIANHGGNLNSIGIESTVIGNIFYTWERLAKLIGSKLLPGLNLTVKDVKQHNTFCGKDCPQTMRKAGKWETFLDYIEQEYILATQFHSFTIEFSSDSPYLNSNGMIKTLPDTPTEVEYSIKFYSETEGYDQTFNFKVTLPAKSAITY